MKIQIRDQVHHFRSPGLQQFLLALREAWPAWLDMADISARFNEIHPRQLARFIDMLEDKQLHLVDYETKTRGRFRLSLPPDEFLLLTAPGNHMRTTDAPGKMPDTETIPLDELLDEDWVNWYIHLMQAGQALHDGNIYEGSGALENLQIAEKACAKLPRWCHSVVLARQAQTLIRISRYREAGYCLRKADADIREGFAHPALAERLALIRAKMHYDRGNLRRAESCLHEARQHATPESAACLNMEALLHGKHISGENKEGSHRALGIALHRLLAAAGHIFLWHGDSSMLDAISFNIGNNLVRGVDRGLLPRNSADTAMRWLAANQYICKKLGIGDDSILVNLIIFDVGIRYGYHIEQWPSPLRAVLNNADNPARLLADSLIQARQMGNRLEIAECQTRLALLYGEGEEANLAIIEARDLFRELGRKDKLRQLETQWQDKNRAARAEKESGKYCRKEKQ